MALPGGEAWNGVVGQQSRHLWEASAQLYWGRMAALLMRILSLYSLFPELDWQFVFVDDFLWLLRLKSSGEMATAIMLVLLSLGTPLSWKKMLMAQVNTWLGFVIDPAVPSVQMAKEKFLLVMKGESLHFKGH